MKIWITKHCLTQGIKEIENAEISKTCSDIIEVGGGAYLELYHGKGKEWHTTKESAIKRAEGMRLKKIESLKKQLKKLEEMKF